VVKRVPATARPTTPFFECRAKRERRHFESGTRRKGGEKAGNSKRAVFHLMKGLLNCDQKRYPAPRGKRAIAKVGSLGENRSKKKVCG